MKRRKNAPLLEHLLLMLLEKEREGDELFCVIRGDPGTEWKMGPGLPDWIS